MRREFRNSVSDSFLNQRSLVMSEQELSMAVGYELDNQQHVNLLQQDMRLLRASLQKFEYTARVKLAGLDEKLNR